MALTMFGLSNCDTVKKARSWLDARGIAYAFHDYKKAGADPVRVAGWIAEAGRERIVNRAGTTFRKLSEADQAALGGDGAADVLVANTSVIKRPIVEHPGGLLVGFKEAEWAAILG
jgi:arsenate reductase (glutaredoxin)